jgi:hypothetical protein
MTLPRLTLRHAFALALPVLIAAGAAAHAQAQSPWPASPPAGGDAGSTAQPPWPNGAAAGGTAPPPFGQSQQQEVPPCLKAFIPLRDDTAKKGEAIQHASARKATPLEACALFNSFIAAESKMMNYAQANAANCGIPPQAIVEMKAGHKKAVEIRSKVCQAAKMQQQAPTGPSLSDALGASQVPSASNVKPGRGTFDTLTGTPLGTTR